MKFEQALKHWKESETAHRAAKLTYDLAFAEALLKSVQPSAERRKAEAEVASKTERALLDAIEIEALAAEHLVMYMRHAEAA